MNWFKENTKTRRSSRQYIDFILKASNKWAIWDPPLERIEVGDYGTVDRQSGHFERHGNVFDNDILDPMDLSSTTDDLLVIASPNGRADPVPPSAFRGLSTAVAYQAAYTFGGKPGAILALYKPVHTRLPMTMDLSPLTKRKDLTGMYIVTGVTRCPSYFYYLAAGGDRGISLAFQPGNNLPSAVGDIQSQDGRWVTEHSGGFYRSGHSDEPGRFTVLMELRQCRMKKTLGWFR